MGTITSGVVKYARTVNLGDYNNKRAEVELAFSVSEDGSDFDKMLKLAGTTAIGKVHDLLALAAPKVAEEAPAATAAAAPKAAKPGAAEKKALEEKAKGASAKAEVVKLKDPLPEVIDVDDMEGGPAKPTGTAEEMEDEELFGGAPAEITDAQIMEKVKNTAQRLGDPARVKTLMRGYGITAPKTCRDIPQEKRQAFITELDAMKKA